MFRASIDGLDDLEFYILDIAQDPLSNVPALGSFQDSGTWKNYMPDKVTKVQTVKPASPTIPQWGRTIASVSRPKPRPVQVPTAPIQNSQTNSDRDNVVLSYMQGIRQSVKPKSMIHDVLASLYGSGSNNVGSKNRW